MHALGLLVAAFLGYADGRIKVARASASGATSDPYEQIIRLEDTSALVSADSRAP